MDLSIVKAPQTVLHNATQLYSDHVNSLITFMLLLAKLPLQNDAKTTNENETMAHGDSSESTQREISNAYQLTLV